jgi:hypothetical protein
VVGVTTFLEMAKGWAGTLHIGGGHEPGNRITVDARGLLAQSITELIKPTGTLRTAM